MIRRVLDELGKAGEALPHGWNRWSRPALRPMIRRGWNCTSRRAGCAARSGSSRCCARPPRIVFTKHYTLGGSHYAYTEGQSDAQAERHFVPGAALVPAASATARSVPRRDAAGRSRRRDPRPGRLLRRPARSCSPGRSPTARTTITSTRWTWRRAAIRQLTAGLGVADYEGAYLPDGDIIFNSTRCVQTVDCWWTEVSNLYRCDGDGRHHAPARPSTRSTTTIPTVTDDGRILYTRWEYNDRGQIYPQPLFQMNPDGTDQTRVLRQQLLVSRRRSSTPAASPARRRWWPSPRATTRGRPAS